jgi:uncharacterized protein YqgV (UPF0045/DUF77 family)
MPRISVQVAIYPLGVEDIAPHIGRFLDPFREAGISYELGHMSSTVWGEAEDVFAALQKAYLRCAEDGRAVVTCTISNACPIPE